MDRIGKSLGLGDELRELDLVERAEPVGQLHASLKPLVALPWRGALPLAGGDVQALDGKRLAAGAARGRHGSERGLARDFVLGLQRRNGVDQCVERKAAFRHHPWGQGCRHRAHGFGQRVAHIDGVAGRVGAQLEAVVEVGGRERRVKNGLQAQVGFARQCRALPRSLVAQGTGICRSGAGVRVLVRI
jgi:hypothetical protein